MRSPRPPEPAAVGCGTARRRPTRWLRTPGLLGGVLGSLLGSLASLGHAAPVADPPAGPAADAAAVARGATIVASRQQGLCVLCHALPGQPAVQQGTVGPPLAGVGARYGEAELRERVTAPERFNPDTVMPSYARRDGFERIAPALRGQALLTPTQIDDVVAWLAAQR